MNIQFFVFILWFDTEEFHNMKRGVLMKVIEYSKNEINAMSSGISIQLQYLVNMKTYLAYKNKKKT